MLNDVGILDKLTDNKVHLSEYPQSIYEDWKNQKTAFLKSSAAPDFIKNILIYKNKTRPHLFFGEAYVAMKVGSSIYKGWFNSWDWISSCEWSNGLFKSKDPFILNMMREFYNDALSKYLVKKMPKILDIQNKFSLTPEPPDLWLVDRNNEHHFIEVKRGKDRVSKEQLFGLLLINKILKHNIHIVWLYEEGTRPPSKQTIDKYIDTFSELKNKLVEVMAKESIK